MYQPEKRTPVGLPGLISPEELSCNYYRGIDASYSILQDHLLDYSIKHPPAAYEANRHGADGPKIS